MAPQTTSRPGWGDLRRVAGDTRPPAPLVILLAFVAQLAWVGVASMLDPGEGTLFAGVVLVAAVGAWWLTVPASMWLAAISFLVADGFVQGSQGQLVWNGGVDLVLMLALVLACALSAESGYDVTSLHPRTPRRRDE